MKQNRPSFYAWIKDFNSKKLETIDVLKGFFNSFLNDKNKILKKKFTLFDDKSLTFKPITTKDEFGEFFKDWARYQYWGRCEYEILAVDWPNKNTVEESYPVKIDVYEQIKPNLSLIIDMAWEYVEPKIK